MITTPLPPRPQYLPALRGGWLQGVELLLKRQLFVDALHALVAVEDVSSLSRSLRGVPLLGARGLLTALALGEGAPPRMVAPCPFAVIGIKMLCEHQLIVYRTGNKRFPQIDLVQSSAAIKRVQCEWQLPGRRFLLLAGGAGLEPAFAASKADVLPLDDPP